MPASAPKKKGAPLPPKEIMPAVTAVEQLECFVRTASPCVLGPILHRLVLNRLDTLRRNPEGSGTISQTPAE